MQGAAEQGPAPRCAIRLVSGDELIVEGSAEDVEKRLSDAARSGPNRLAWLEHGEGGDPIGVNPTHVAALVPRP